MLAFPPARSLPEAYQLALRTLGSRTNQLACIEAKRNKDLLYWDIVFEETNASRVVVSVADSSTDACIDCPLPHLPPPYQWTTNTNNLKGNTSR